MFRCFFLQIMNSLRHCVRLGQQVGLRRICTTPRVLSQNIDPESTPTFKKLKANQERFQREDLVEDVYIKGGITDVVLYRVILFFTLFGVVLDFKTFYDLSLV